MTTIHQGTFVSKSTLATRLQVYEARGVRTPLAQRNLLRKELMEGRDPLALPPPKRRRLSTRPGVITINGKSLTARRALERYPQLRGFLQTKKRLTEKNLHAKLRREFRNGRIQDYVINEVPPEFRRISDDMDSTFTKYKLDDPRIRYYDIVSIFEYLRSQMLRLIEAHPNTKVHLNVHVVMIQRSTGIIQKKGLF